MQTEYEVRILEINQEELEEKLKNIGAIHRGDYFQKRYVYDVKPKVQNKWIRLRTNGKKTTLCIKDLTSKTVDGMKEIEIEVDDFDKANLLLESLGYQNKGFQENKRTQYRLDTIEIDIDTWPGIPTYVEIEGPNEEAIHRFVEKLGYDYSKVNTTDVEDIYFQYGYTKEDMKSLRFKEETK